MILQRKDTKADTARIEYGPTSLWLAAMCGHEEVFNMLSSELVNAKREEEVEEIREVLSLHREQAVNHRPKP